MADDLLDLLEELIKGAYGGVWPLTLDGWRVVAASYGLGLRCVDQRMLFGRAAAWGLVICVYVGDEKWNEILPAICHELAECLLASEGIADFNAPGLSRHHVAQLVEFRYRRWLRERK